jgi:hypothetical protein
MISGLKHLTLGKNLLGGPILTSLGKLHNLMELDISEAGLVSTLLPELGNLTNLKVMELLANHLFGSLPPCFTKMKRMKTSSYVLTISTVSSP